MTDLEPTPRRPEDPRDDVLINRVVDGEATPADWAELDVVAERDPSVWSRLAEAQRAHAALQRGVEDALTVAELVDLPHPSLRLERAWNTRLRVWGGWLVAAVVALAWIGNFAQVRSLQQQQQTTQALQAGVTGNLTPEQLLEAYMANGKAEGRVVGEMPMVMLETVPTADGKAQITFVRPLVERVVVDQVYEVGQSDAGRPVPVPADRSAFSRGAPL
ncbi:MAG: hypothetical protein ACTS27_06165 [Phycisphaerales bacterium]